MQCTAANPTSRTAHPAGWNSRLPHPAPAQRRYPIPPLSRSARRRSPAAGASTAHQGRRGKALARATEVRGRDGPRICISRSNPPARRGTRQSTRWRPPRMAPTPPHHYTRCSTPPATTRASIAWRCAQTRRRPPPATAPRTPPRLRPLEPARHAAPTAATSGNLHTDVERGMEHKWWGYDNACPRTCCQGPSPWKKDSSARARRDSSPLRTRDPCVAVHSGACSSPPPPHTHSPHLRGGMGTQMFHTDSQLTQPSPLKYPFCTPHHTTRAWQRRPPLLVHG